MKNYLIIIFLSCALVSCKNDKSTNTQNATAENNIQTKTGNKITQKVKVEASPVGLNIDAKKALDMIAKDKNIKVLDVRTPEEIAEGAYPNSLQINFNADDFKSEINKLDKNDTYIVYCRSGGRSKKAVSMMKAFGFSNAYNMEEGYKGFAKASK